MPRMTRSFSLGLFRKRVRVGSCALKPGSWVTDEGQAQWFEARNTAAEPLLQMLCELYRACGDKEHADWKECDSAMREQDAVIVLVRPERV